MAVGVIDLAPAANLSGLSRQTGDRETSACLTGVTPSLVHECLRRRGAARGGLRAQMESRFGHDFGRCVCIAMARPRIRPRPSRPGRNGRP